MASLPMLRRFINELSIVQKCYFTSSNYKFLGSRLLQNQNARCSARVLSSSAVENEKSEQEESNEERIRKQRRNVGLIIGSSVGLISSLYFLFRRLNHARAEGKTLPIDSNTEGSLDEKQDEGEDETGGKRKKGKHGFKERRVRNYFDLKF